MQSKSFQLEQSVPGAFLLQGLLGGALGGFISSVVTALIGFIAYSWTGGPLDDLIIICIICSALLIAWAIFLLARVSISDEPGSLTLAGDAPIKRENPHITVSARDSRSGMSVLLSGRSN